MLRPGAAVARLELVEPSPAVATQRLVAGYALREQQSFDPVDMQDALFNQGLALQTGDGRPLPKHLKTQIGRELDRLELLLEQIKEVEAERDALLGARQVATPAPAAMLLNIKGIGPEFAAILWPEGFRHFDNRRQVASYPA